MVSICIYYTIPFLLFEIVYILIFVRNENTEIQDTYIFNHLSLFINSFEGNIGSPNLLCDTACLTILHVRVTELG